MELARPVGRDAHRHGVDREVTTNQVVAEVVTELDRGVARHLVVAVGAERRDLETVVALADADGAELDAGVPQRVGPAAQKFLHLLGAGVGGEVEVAVLGEPAEQRVAHTPAHQVQLVACGSEHRAELAQDPGAAVQRNQRTGQQFGSSSSFGHVR